MQRDEFKTWGIKHFTPEEIQATGAKLADVQSRLIASLDEFRSKLGMPFNLIENGLTTGSHKAPEHRAGLAVDGFLPSGQDIACETVFKTALLSGFRGIGIYWNGTIYSFHFDLRTSYAFWGGSKRPGGSGWNYGPLILDPRKG